jgi:hypothetical protein
MIKHNAFTTTQIINFLIIFRYVGSRPIKLRKSTWKQRGIEERKKKEGEKKALLALIDK